MEAFGVFLAGVVGSMLFWPVAFVVLLGLLYRNSEWWAASFTLLVGVMCLFAFRPIDWSYLAWHLGYYVFAGFLFTFAKYYMYTRKSGRKFKEWYARQDKERDKNQVFYRREDPKRLITVSWDDKKQQWDTSYEKVNFAGYLTSWIAFWPIYAALILLEDFIHEAAIWIAEHFGGLYNKIANLSYN
jgi:predicted membrane protein